jgi:hypothetical protein
VANVPQDAVLMRLMGNKSARIGALNDLLMQRADDDSNCGVGA